MVFIFFEWCWLSRLRFITVHKEHLIVRMSGEGVDPRDRMLPVENLSLDYPQIYDLQSIADAYEPVKKSFQKAAEEDGYRDILGRSAEVEKAVRKEHGSVCDPHNNYLDRIKYKIRSIKDYFGPYSDELFSMLMKKLPYKKGAAANKVCKRALEDFEINTWNNMINEEYEDERKIADLSIGVQGTDEKDLKIYEEPEAKKLLSNCNNTMDSVLITRILSHYPDAIENFERFWGLSDVVYNKENIDPMLDSVTDLFYMATKNDDTDLERFSENVNGMNKVFRGLEHYRKNDEVKKKRKKYALRNMFDLCNENLDPKERDLIENTITAFPDVINVSPKIIHERYNRKTVDSPPGSINKGDYMDLVEELRYKEAKREMGFF